MKGKISKRVAGEVSEVIKKGVRKCVSTFFKKDISSKIVRVKIKVRNMSEIIKIFLRNNHIKYFSKVFIIF